MNNEIQLEPCPFCGSKKVDKQRATNIDGSFHSWKIWCARCNCRTGPHKTLKAAEKTWNRRIERLEVMALREDLARCRHQASYSIGSTEALQAQLAKVREIATEALHSAIGE